MFEYTYMKYLYMVPAINVRGRTCSRDTRRTSWPSGGTAAPCASSLMKSRDRIY